MQICLFSSWQVRCGIANYSSQLVSALNTLEDTAISVVPFDRKPHPRADYVSWGKAMNGGDVAHIQHEYSFFGYLFPWRNHFNAFVTQIHKPLVITKHVSFDGRLLIATQGIKGFLRQVKWALYNRWLGPYATYLNRDTFAVAQHVIVLSTRLKEQLVTRGLCPDSISVIPPGVPSMLMAHGGEQLRTKWGWQDKHILGHFGFIAEAKGHRIGVEALRYLPEHYVLLIAGGVRRPVDQPVLNTLQRQIIQLGLQTRVRITGYLEENEISTHLSACDVLIYPNTHADFSYSVYLGLAYQVAPIVLSNIPSHHELASEETVAFFQNNQPEALAQTIRNIVESPTRRMNLMENSRTFVQQNTWENVARQTRDVYLRVLGP